MDSGLNTVFQVDVKYKVNRHFKTNKGRAVGKPIDYELVTLIQIADDKKSVVVKDAMSNKRYTLTEDSFPYILPLKDLTPRKARTVEEFRIVDPSVTESRIVNLPPTKTCGLCVKQYTGGHILICENCHCAWAAGMKANIMPDVEEGGTSLKIAQNLIDQYIRVFSVKICCAILI